MRITYNVAASLDGCIATAQGGVAWLDAVHIDRGNTGYEAFYASVDGLVMGRATYDFVYDYGSWPYEDKPTWVCTHREIAPLPGCVLRPETGPSEVCRAAEAMGVEHLWLVGGGVLARAFLEAGLLTHIGVSVMPILLGSGIRLVDTLPRQILLEQEASRDLAGFTHIDYRVLDAAR